jgi:hypothetical protein
MKKILRLTMILFGVLQLNEAQSQWCVPTTAVPYSPDMPGITHVKFNTIDRTSADLENMSNSYVNTGLSTDVALGQSYDIDISFTIDAFICPDMNIRVWIDFNHDGQLDDAGETVISANNLLPPLYNGTITIPATAMTGVTRMRVTAKMTPNGGHSLPTPCDNPADVLGYHGEFEDYEVNIINTTGINDIGETSAFSVSSSSDRIDFRFSLSGSAKAGLELFNITGQKAKVILPYENYSSNDYSFFLNNDELNSKGIYLAVLTINDRKFVKRIAIE